MDISCKLMRNKVLRSGFLAFTIILLLSLSPFGSRQVYAVSGFEVYAGKITERDKLTLPPVCRLILFEKPSAHQPEGQKVNGDLFRLPQYRMALGNIHLHHYCYGLMSRFRYFESSNPVDRKLFSEKFQSELDYVIDNMHADDNARADGKKWPFYDQLYYEQAEMLFLTNMIPEAIMKAQKVLSISPGYVKAHALLSDIYVKEGKRELAIEQLHTGLASTPSAKALLRRLHEIAPNDPLLSQHSDAHVNATTDTNSTSNKNGQTASSSADNKSESKDKDLDNPALPQANPNDPQNPYCRFCP